MKIKMTVVLLAAALFLSVLSGCDNTSDQAAEDKLSVRTSFYVLYDFAVKIGGDKAVVTNMVPDGTEPHDWEPTPVDIKELENADILLYNGAGLEHWTDSVLSSLQNQELIAVETSKGIELLDSAHSHEEDKEDVSDADPHVWLSPVNAKKQMENIKNAFIQADPANKDYYEANYTKYAAEFDNLDQKFEETLSPLPNKNIVVAHAAFGYLCSAYGLEQMAIDGLSADSEPDPARMAEIVNFARDKNVKVIFFEELVSPKVAQAIAGEVNVKTDVLSTLENLSDEQKAAGDDYFSVMEQNLARLKAALE